MTGARKYRLMCDIASGDYTWVQLRDRHQYRNVTRFARQHKLEIEDIRNSMVEGAIAECAGLWIAQKAMRVAEYQEIVEAINRKLHELESSGAKWFPVQALKVKAETLRAVAEELGQIPERPKADNSEGPPVDYAIRGIGTDELAARLR
jgi:hypothetical protein